jgi:hypothetical protein
LSVKHDDETLLAFLTTFERCPRALNFDRTVVERSESVANIPAIEEMEEWLRERIDEPFLVLSARARQRLAMKTADRYEHCLIKVMKEECKELAEQMKIANAGVKLVSQNKKAYPADFNEGVAELVGTLWNPITERIEEVTLEEALGVGGMYRKRSIFFIGVGGLGKTTLISSLAAELSNRHCFDRFYEGTALDPIGLLTKQNVMTRMGAIAISDFSMVSDRDKPLDMMNSLALFDAEHSTDFPARYHTAKLSELRPRLFAVNPGKDDRGNVDFGSWFLDQANPMPAVHAFVNGNADYVKVCDSRQAAIVRRIIVFKITEPLYAHVGGVVAPSAEDAEEMKMAMLRAYKL